MKTPLTLIGLAILLLLIGVVGFLAGLFSDAPPRADMPRGPGFFDGATTQPETPPSAPAGRTVAITLKDGRRIDVLESSLWGGGTTADGQVLLEDDAAKGYLVIYSPADESFTITLVGEPLNAKRLEAQRFLLDRLKISEDDACLLRHAVLVPRFVNEQYAGENLGFNFCPGAVELP